MVASADVHDVVWCGVMVWRCWPCGVWEESEIRNENDECVLQKDQTTIGCIDSQWC
jgi:hypothetical protein